VKELSEQDRERLARFRAEEAAAGWDWSGASDEELAKSAMFARYRLDDACAEIGRAFREPFERMTDHISATFSRFLTRRS
jgi:hypothetical protein